MLDTISMAEMLKGQYREAFEKADMYSTISSENAEVDDEKMMNLYDLLLEAQNNGKPVEKIIGKDIEEFCKSYFKVEKKWYVSLLSGLYKLLIWVTCWTVLELVFLPEGENWKTVTTDIIPYIGGLITFSVVVFLFRTTKKVIFKTKIKPIVYYVSILLFFIGSFILVYKTVGDMRVEVPVIWVLGICAGYEVVYFVVRSILRYRTQGTIRKCTREERMCEKEDKKIKKMFNEEMCMESSNGIIAKAMVKRYERLNKKSLRKKNRELTFEEYASHIRKEEYWGNILTPAIFIVLTVVSIIGQIISSGVMDGLMFAVILIVVEGLIYYWIKKINDQGSRQRLAIIAICEERGIGLLEYAQELHNKKEEE